MQFDHYPFTQADLLAGLRQLLDDPSLTLVDVQPMLPLPPVMPGGYGYLIPNYTQTPLLITVHLVGEDQFLGLMLYEAQQSIIRREHGFYRQLSAHLPIVTPLMVAGNHKKEWLLLQLLDHLHAPDAWNVDHYREAVDNLAILHDRFWDLQEDLDVFFWLWRPLDRDFEKVRGNIQAALGHLLQQPHPELANDYFMTLFEVLEQKLPDIAATLLEKPLTLTHGSYWAGNIATPLDGSRQKVLNWQYAAIAPAILDVIMFHQSTLIHLAPAMSLSTALMRYRAKLEDLQDEGVWSDADWDHQWDFGLMWLFALHWMPRIAEATPQAYIYMHPRLDKIWFSAVADAITRQLGISLP